MSAGCRNPNAVNYNGAATSEDYSCIYLFKHGEDCHKFIDVVPADTIDQSFTMSYSLAGQSWVFFHDYQADMYIHTRNNLYSAKNNYLFKHHEGAPGTYYDSTVHKPFFIDVLFRDFTKKPEDATDILLETVNWITDFLPASGRDQMFSTLTHISAWTAQQHTGKIALESVFADLQYQTSRRTKGEWSFNEIRDILKDGTGQFLLDLFHDFALDTDPGTTQVEEFPVWYEQGLLEDKWICVRFEYDNAANARVILHNTNITAQISGR